MTASFSPDAAPRANGMLYPGGWPDESCVVTFDEITPLAGIPAEAAPVLAVGSNASPAQLRHKFLSDPDLLRMPMSRAQVDGLYCAYVPWETGYGAYPATPVIEPGAQTELMVQWIDPEQLELLDSTEGGYTRTWLSPADGVFVTVDGNVLEGVWVYAADSGPLVLDGHVVRMVTPWGDVEPGPYAVATQAELRALLEEEPT